MKRTGERAPEAEILRMHGEFARLDGDVSTAQSMFDLAIESALRLGALGHALRAATAAAKLNRKLGRSEGHGLGTETDL